MVLFRKTKNKMKDNLIWQTRDEFPVATNPLQKLREILSFTSRDCSQDKMIACMYGIICGWNDDAYEELKEKHNWSDDDVECQKLWHENYKKAWNGWINGDTQKTNLIMKTTDETIKAVIGISTEAKELTPMDKGECKLCMKAYAKEFKPIFDKMITWVEDDFDKGLFIEEFEQFLHGEVK